MKYHEVFGSYATMNTNTGQKWTNTLMYILIYWIKCFTMDKTVCGLGVHTAYKTR